MAEQIGRVRRGAARSVLRHIDQCEQQELLRQRHRLIVTLPLTPDSWARLEFSNPITAHEKERLMLLLDLMLQPKEPRHA